MKPEWWSGKNLRTGQIGIFPRNYVDVVPNPPPTSYYCGAEKEKAQNASYYGAPQAPTPTNPYASSAPPMAMANQSQEQVAQAESGKGGKVGEMGKKFGKKLGNAAIFGAGRFLYLKLVLKGVHG